MKRGPDTSYDAEILADEFAAAQHLLQGMIGRRVVAAELEETRIAISTDDGSTYYFYGFMGEAEPESTSQAREDLDREERVKLLYAMAERVFSSGEAARRWMETPNAGLDGDRPLDQVGTAKGAREIEDLLGRIADGIFG